METLNFSDLPSDFDPLSNISRLSCAMFPRPTLTIAEALVFDLIQEFFEHP